MRSVPLLETILILTLGGASSPSVAGLEARKEAPDRPPPLKSSTTLLFLIASVSSGILINSGHLLENLVFTALRRRHAEIHYYRTRTGA